MKATLMKNGGFAIAIAALCLAPATRATACVVPSLTKSGAATFVVPELNSQSDQQPQDQGQEAQARSIVGLWNVTFYSGKQVVDLAFETWHSDGTETLIDITDPIEENACLGVWTQTSNGTIKLKHVSWTFDNNGNWTGTAILRETLTLGVHADSFSGKEHLDYYDTMGHLTASFDGTVNGTRINPPGSD